MKQGRPEDRASGQGETTWVHPLNPDAGMTPMPTDPRELEAALRAGRITQRITPYYGFRYGERGARFTRSDSAFLATLPGHAAHTVQRQVEWLAGVLANRGMPTLLLEQHLRVLAHELVRAIPERKADFEKLVACSRALGARRNAALPDRVGRGLAAAFPAAAGLPPSRLAASVGQILIAAVADERVGMINAVPSIEAFFLDRSLFPPAFVDAARITIARARKA